MIEFKKLFQPNTTQKHLIGIFLITIISILLSGQIDYDNPGYQHTDQIKYRAMAEVSPELNSEIIKPFVFRILAPWIAGIFPFKTETSFFLLNFITLILVPISFYYLLQNYKTDKTIAFILTICFVFNRYLFQFLAWNYFQLCDSLAILFLILAFQLIIKRKWFYLGLILFVGIFVKEIVLIILPSGFIYLFFNSKERKDYISLSAISFGIITTFILIRIFVEHAGGESLFTQFYTRIPQAFTLTALTKKLIITFTPFGLVPLFFYREAVQFFQKNPELFVYLGSVFLTTIFGDHERLMSAFIPVYFILIGRIIELIIGNLTEKKTIHFYILAISISVLSSIYHLWGFVKYPDRNFSALSTILLTIVCAAIFYSYRLFGNRETTSTKVL